MSLESHDTIDAIGIDESSGEIVLAILDDWTWQNMHDHLSSLLEKINKYVDVVVDGEIYQLRSGAKDRQFCIRIYFKEEIPNQVLPRLETIGNQLHSFGIRLWFGHSLISQDTA